MKDKACDTCGTISDACKNCQSFIDRTKQLEATVGQLRRICKNMRTALEPGFSPDNIWNSEWRKRLDKILTATPEQNLAHAEASIIRVHADEFENWGYSGLRDKAGKAVARILRASADKHESGHLSHGAGTAESGPDDPDCSCRGTDDQWKCAKAGCGFCQAAEKGKT